MGRLAAEPDGERGREILAIDDQAGRRQVGGRLQSRADIPFVQRQLLEPQLDEVPRLDAERDGIQQTILGSTPVERSTTSMR